MATFIIGLVLAAALAGVSVKLYRDRKNGKLCPGCPGGSCCGCHMGKKGSKG